MLTRSVPAAGTPQSNTRKNGKVREAPAGMPTPPFDEMPGIGTGDELGIVEGPGSGTGMDVGIELDADAAVGIGNTCGTAKPPKRSVKLNLSPRAPSSKPPRIVMSRRTRNGGRPTQNRLGRNSGHTATGAAVSRDDSTTPVGAVTSTLSLSQAAMAPSAGNRRTDTYFETRAFISHLTR